MLHITRHISTILKDKENFAIMPPLSSHNDSPRDEVVEDSEPEREEQRRKLKAAKKATQSTVRPPLSVIPVDTEPVPVDVEGSDNLSYKHLEGSAPSIVLYTVEELSASTGPEAASTSFPSLSHDDLPKYGHPIPVTRVEENGPDALEPVRTLNLTHFANNATVVQHNRRSTSPAPVISSLNQARALSTSTAPSRWLNCPLPEKRMKIITKCPCCELAWTARKSSQMKWEHIARCAKKNDYTVETLLTRLDQQLASTDTINVEGKSKKRKAKTPLEQKEVPKPDTLLERVTHEAVPPKRGRKQAVPETVQNVSQAHQLITEKARDVLLAGESVVPAPHVESATSPVAAQLPLATQAFVPSKFGGARRTVSLLNDNPLKERPPDAGATLTSDRFSYLPRDVSPGPDISSNAVVPSEAQTSLANLTASTLDLTSSPATAFRKPRSSSPKKRLSLRQIVRQEDTLHNSDTDSISSENGWVDEGAWGADTVLVWDGDRSDGSTSSSVVLSKAKGKKNKGEGPLTSPIQAPEQPKKRGRQRKDVVVQEKESKPTDEETVAMIEKELRTMIEEDEELYLRILRYEPMKFDDLLKRALDRELPERKLKERLRNFLDKQCINFYTAEPTGTRKRY
ncbi:hypothetical protein DACRYDRAFT_113138 [Dacryopinax primogenitus]|uniref:Structure-specific endonuclease subunit SLX4 n=1 Tax=Dacryopinax primogenitus (strain DJM 731) TaxID=1858805 RepID=M5GBR6_DACPD|nr:uncharacterized protein DACRYDRAFT_113138 [Dacryopinax primogenitus]EJU06429.1 hypothetical protein DACRYDRAFT_113138 [Dacryopinax primogenitus]